MTKEQAQITAAALGGEAWQSGGNIWLVRFKRPDGRLIVLSEDLVCEYEDKTAFAEGVAAKTIELPAAEASASR